MNIKTQNCQPDLIDSFLNGDLDLAQELQLTDHLEGCNACRLTLESTAAEPDGWMEAGQLLKPTKFDWNPEAEPDDLSNPIPLQIRNVLDSLTPSEDPQMLGQLGGYDVSGVVGAGAMGVVLKASDKSLDRTVAIKVLSPHLASSGAARKRFAREAKAAAAVLHANVIAIHGVSNDQSMPHLVMPYVRGTSLQKRINDDGPLPVKEVLRIGAQIAAGLAAAHAQGLVHRDIKPANILLEEGVERVAITDFGLARAVDDASLTRTGIIAGTPQYMSPEQSRGESVDQRSDLFSLGSVMYAMCAGRPPFRSETTYGVIQRINNDRPTSIREINPDVPNWLVTIVNKLMSKQATERFESAQEVSELLEQCLAHVQQPSATPLPASLARSRSSRFFSGSGRKTGVIAVMLAFGLGLLGFGLWQGTAPPDISGKWHGDGWGEVELKHQALGQYKGEYTDTFGDQPGTMEIKWSRIERRFNGTWREGKDRFGDVSLRHSDDQIFGAWTTNEKSDINPGRPKLADLQWTRRHADKASGVRDPFDGVVKPLEDFHARSREKGVGSGKPDSQHEAEIKDLYQVYSINSKHRNWKAVLQCLTDDCRDELSMEYLFAVTLMAEFNVESDDKEAQQNGFRSKAFLEFLHKKYPTLATTSSSNLQNGEMELQEKFSSPVAEERRQARIEMYRTKMDSENEQLFEMLSQVMSTLNRDTGQANQHKAKLVDVVIQDNEAFAFVDSGGREDRESIAFKKIDGSWKLDRLISKSVFDEMLARDQQIKGIMAQQEKALKALQATQEDIATAIKVADKFVTATLRGRKAEMESLLSPSHDPSIGGEFIEDVMPIVFGLGPKFTEAFINHQDPDDMLLITPTLPADKRIQSPVRLTFGMKRERDGWRVCEVLFPTPKELDNLIAFYETGEPLQGVYRMERDLKMPGVPEELRLAKASLHTATKKLQIAEEQHSKEDGLEPLRLKVEAARKEFQRVQNEVQFRSARRIDLTSEAFELSELPSKDIVAKAKENINKVVTKMFGEQKTEMEIQEKLREMLQHTHEKQEELRVQPEGTFGSFRSKLATLEKVFRDEIRKRESEQATPKMNVEDPPEIPQEAVLYFYNKRTSDSWSQVMDELIKEGHPIVQIDIDQHPDLAKRFKVARTPMLTVLRGGNEEAHLFGGNPEMARKSIELEMAVTRRRELELEANRNDEHSVDKPKEQRETDSDDVSVMKEAETPANPAPLLTNVEEVETHLRELFEERKSLTNADVEFRLIVAGNYSCNRRYHVWLNGENRRADSKGVSDNGRSDMTQILTPRYSFFEDRIDGGPQYSARDSKNTKKPVGWSGVSSVPDLRKFGLIAWNVESIQSHPWGKNLLNKVRHDVRVETGKHKGHPITIVKSVNKYDNEHGKSEGWNEYWLSPAHGNLPIYLETGSTLPDAEKRIVVMKQHVQWKQFDNVWFPKKIEYIYQITGKQDSKSTVEVTTARFNLDPFPSVFDPIDAAK